MRWLGSRVVSVLDPGAEGRGGATVLKVGGTDSASGASRKFFLDPPTFWPVGGQNIAYIDKSA